MKKHNILLPDWWKSSVKDVEKTLTSLVSKLFSSKQREHILSAKELANLKHKGQQRKGGEDYVIHPYRTALSLIMEFSVLNPELIVASLLHDILEDTDQKADEIKEEYGISVFNMIVPLTRTEKRPQGGDSVGSVYYQNIIKGGKNCILIKLADKLDNIRDALNHPKQEKQELYVRECYETYIPLIQYLQDDPFEKKIIGLLKEAMENHPFYSNYIMEKHFTNIINQDFAPLISGEYISYKNLSQKIYPSLESYLEKFLLFNPALEYWLNYDGVQIVKMNLNTVDLVSNVALKIAKFLDNKDGITRLLENISIPNVFKDTSRNNLWNTVKLQLHTLVDTLKTDTQPTWIKPILDDAKWILLLIHSKLFVPANLTFSIWKKDHGAILVQKDKKIYEYLSQNEATYEEWKLVLYSLLNNREAFWRYITGEGSLLRVNSVLELIGKSTLNSRQKEKLIAARFLSEYLDVIAGGEYSKEEISKQLTILWEDCKKQNFAILKESSDRTKKIFGGTCSESYKYLQYLEILGLDKVKSLCRYSGTINNLYQFLKALFREIQCIKNPSFIWIYFDIVEISKRKELFLNALKNINEGTNYSDINNIGIDTSKENIENNTIFTITPGKKLALKNRLSEIEDGDLEKIRKQDFSAVAIFDTLLKDKLTQNSNKPIWMPRVYRILDTISDFDPCNVQTILVSFKSAEDIEPFKTCLPIPRDEIESKDYEIRKDILSRFVCITIFNYAVTIGIHSASVDCHILNNNTSKYGFNNQELAEKLLAEARKLGYFDAYGNFLQNYYAQIIDITSSFESLAPDSFTKDDMSYGKFLGIDIGGTDIKVCIFDKFQSIQSIRTPSKSFSTFASDKEIFLEDFCNRIISEITPYLKEQKLDWKDIDGIGISWAGAVRNSKIVGFSKVLGKIKIRGQTDKTVRQDSLPQDIQSIDIADTIKRGLLKQFPDVSDNLVITMENDGNAEAYGNYCALEKGGTLKPGGKVIIKLGTSLAGGHVNSFGAVSPHVTEFGKITLNFIAKLDKSFYKTNATREYVSSIGIRNLSRTFHFYDELLFGTLSNYNASEECCDTRIEANELGELLKFWELVDEDKLENNRFLKELASNDNKRGEGRYQEILDILTKKFNNYGNENNNDFNNLLKEYIHKRGYEQCAKKLGKSLSVIKDICINKIPFTKDDTKFKSFRINNSDDLSTYCWQLGLNRTYLIYKGRELSCSCKTDEIQKTSSVSLDIHLLAPKILGTVALFSQTGLHIANLIALLYNIYKKRNMKEVILAGGVLTGLTGTLVRQQAVLFLSKYYDKVFGAGKNLEEDSIKLSQADTPALIGPLGAAMIANRTHKMNGLIQMQKCIDSVIGNHDRGEKIPLQIIRDSVETSRATEEAIKNYLDKLVSESMLFPGEGEEDIYTKL